MPKKQSKSSWIPLVDNQQLEEFIGELKGLKEYQRDSLIQRWFHQLLWWDQRSRRARRWYFALRLIIIVGGVSIPVLTGLTFGGVYLRVLTAVISAVVAGCAAWEGVANYGEVWREKRRGAELLKVEAWRYFQLAGDKYANKNHEQAYPYFAEEVEKLIAKEIGEYVALFDQTKSDSSSSNRSGSAKPSQT